MNKAQNCHSYCICHNKTGKAKISSKLSVRSLTIFESSLSFFFFRVHSQDHVIQNQPFSSRLVTILVRIPEYSELARAHKDHQVWIQQQTDDKPPTQHSHGWDTKSSRAQQVMGRWKKGFNLHWGSEGAERGEEQNTGRAGTNEPRNCTKKAKWDTKPPGAAPSLYDSNCLPLCAHKGISNKQNISYYRPWHCLLPGKSFKNAIRILRCWHVKLNKRATSLFLLLNKRKVNIRDWDIFHKRMFWVWLFGDFFCI